ncbi:MAG: hypothetical protein WCX97_02965 [Candidatus Magasanikbacteria bacterium]
MKKIAIIIAGAVFVAVFFIGLSLYSIPVQAATTPVSTTPLVTSDLGIQYGQATGLVSTDIRIIIARIIRIALSLLGIILVALILYGGFLWMTAGGNEEQIGKAKKVLRNAVIGLAIILSAYAITIFVFKVLGYDAFPQGPVVRPPAITNLSGSGALGRVIKDHYPTRDQKDVPRNTKIIITFFKPIALDTGWITKKAEASKPLGSCKDDIKDFKTDCDQLILSSSTIDVVKITRTAVGNTFVTTETSINGAAVLASAVGGKIDTIVIRPNDTLGSPSEDVIYKVYVGRNIKWDDSENNNPGIFDDFVEKTYYWNFTCGTIIDSNPPYVVNVFPAEDQVEFKNTEVQVIFSEPVDPTGIQGLFTATSSGGVNYFALNGNNAFLKITPEIGSFAAGEGFPSGTVKLTGNYRMLTFTPSAVCGTNACGKPMYCLPTPLNTTSTYRIMLKSARTIAGEGDVNFESLPFTGISDMASNALDSSYKPDGSGKVGPPNKIVNVASVETPVFNNQLTPDNYWWSFKIKDEMDLVSPYLRQIVPGLDKNNVLADQRLAMVFSKRMRVEPLYNIAITEHPSPEERCAGRAGCIAIPLWKVPRALAFGVAAPGTSDRFVTTTVDIAHGLFLKELRQYYLPELTSDIEDVGFNCFYPGLGPGGDEIPFGHTNGSDVSRICDQVNDTYCCDVVKASLPEQYKAYCCNGESNYSSSAGDPVQFNSTTCRDMVGGDSYSPLQ